MKNMILLTNGSDASLDNQRTKAVLSIVARKELLEGHEYKILGNDVTKNLQAIRKLRGRLSFDFKSGKIIAQYIPSAEAKKQLMDTTVNESWDEGIIKKQQKLIRITQGAIFRFSVEGSEETIEAFITDWSPFPVAAAIAVHKDHPAITTVKKDEENYFTGLFVRHPLTGDIIPVFVADWVKPEFGTGAVIVNPAHNQADLDFARKVGLPIRFGLVSQQVTGDPATWPNAPVIKMGHTTKTGRYDNLIPEEAVQKYFEELHTFKHADKFTDIGVGAHPLFELEKSETGNYIFEPKSGEIQSVVEAEKQDGIRCNLRFMPIIEVLSDIDPDGEVIVVVHAGEVGSSLLFARCLFNDLYGKPLVPHQIIQVQKVDEGKPTAGLDPMVLNLAVSVQASNNQPAVLKKQILEQVERFVKNHREMRDAYDTTIFESKEYNSVAYAKIKTSIVSANYQKAFNDLYSVQKNLYQAVNKGIADEQAVKLYFACAYILSGADYPDSVAVSEVWESI